MTQEELQTLRTIIREEIGAMLKPKKLPFSQSEYEQEVRKNPKHFTRYFETHELPDEVKYA